MLVCPLHHPLFLPVTLPHLAFFRYSFLLLTKSEALRAQSTGGVPIVHTLEAAWVVVAFEHTMLEGGNIGHSDTLRQVVPIIERSRHSFEDEIVK